MIKLSLSKRLRGGLIDKYSKLPEKSKNQLFCLLFVFLIGMTFMGNMINLEINESNSETEKHIFPQIPLDLYSRRSQNLIESGQQSGSANQNENSVKDVLTNTKQIETDIGNDFGKGIAVDSQENIILVGETESKDFQTLKANDFIHDGFSDAFVSKFNKTGGLLWSTFLGGIAEDGAWDVVTDSQDNIYVTGYTTSYDFPGLAAHDDSFNGGERDAFITKFSPSGAIIWSTFLGGAQTDEAYGITIDSQDNILVTGYTASDNFPTRNPYFPSRVDRTDCFISQLSENGTLIWSTYLGTVELDYSFGVATDSYDNVYIVGSSRFYVDGHWWTTDVEPMIAKFNSTGTLIGIEYFGGMGGFHDDQAFSVTIDSQDNAIVTGVTESNNFPTMNTSYTVLRGNKDGFVTMFNSTMDIIFSTYLGGNGIDEPSKILVDSQDNIIVTGTTSGGFPIVNSLDTTSGGLLDGFIAMFSATTHTLEWSTYLGGEKDDRISGVCIDAQDNLFVTGYTESPDFPTISAYDDTHIGTTNADSFITKFTNRELVMSTYFGVSLEDIPTIVPTQTPNPLEELIAGLIASGFLLPVSIIGSLAIGTLFIMLVLRRRKRATGDDVSILKVFLFSVPYGFRVLFKNKRKYLSLIASFTIAVAFVMSMLLWVEIAPDVAIREAMSQTTYHLMINEEESAVETLDTLHTWLEERPWVETMHRVRPCEALFGIENKSADYNWRQMDPDDPIYISSSSAINILSNEFLETVKYHFAWEGDFQVNETHCLISKQFLQALNDTLGWSLGVGDTFNISMVSNIPGFGQWVLKDWHTHNFTLNIGGVYTRVPEPSLLDLSFTAESLGDGIFIAEASVPTTFFEDLITTKVFPETLFVRLSPSELLKSGVLQVGQQIEILKDKINTQFYGSFIVEEQTAALYEEIAKYQSTRVLILVIFAPIIICAASLVFFWTNFHSKTRREELRILRSRGGNLNQVFGLISAEALGVSILGGIPGIILGALFTYYLVNGGQLILNWEIFLAFVIKLLDFILTWAIGVGICIALMLFASLWRIYKFVQVEMELKRERESNLQRFISNHALDIAVLTAGMFLLMLVIDVDTVAQISRSPYYVLFLFFMLGTWIGIAQLLARSVNKLASFLSKGFISRLGSQITLIGKNFERQQENTFIIAVLLIITFSISVFVVIFITSAGSNAALLSDYEIGADFKIYTSNVDLSFAQKLEADAGIDQCMAIQKTNAWLGTAKVDIYGVNASKYLHIGSWAPTSFLSGTPEENLQRLANTTRGMIINDHLASILNIGINDELLLKVWTVGGHTKITYNIVGIIYSAPGFGVMKKSGGQVGFLENHGGLLINGHEMEGPSYDNITTSNLFFARAPDSNDIPTKLETQNRLLENNQISSRIRYIKVSELPPPETFLSLIGMTGILWLNLIGSLVILAILIYFFFGTIVFERKTEFAIMRACGASTKAVKRLVFLEGLLLLAITLAEGYGIGMLFAWIYTTISFPAIHYPVPLPYILDIPIMLIGGLLGLSLLVFIIGSNLSSKQITGQKIALILKNL